MNGALLLAVALAASGLAALPAASATPPCDPEGPCDPPPLGVCHGTQPDPLKAPVAWAKWALGCL